MKIVAGLVALGVVLATPVARAAETPDGRAVLATYADIAEAAYADSLLAARRLGDAVEALIAAPAPASLQAARAAWLAARVPYQQTEVYRFGNAIVDDWEGRVNSWPLDEGLIDYVAPSYGAESDENAFYAANVIANSSILVGGRAVDATVIDKELLAGTLHQLGGVEANVATGYHAIEFLLWGQDLNGAGPGAGRRPASDFDPAGCIGGNCERRGAYLRAATGLLIDDLEVMAGYWKAGGKARLDLMAGGPESGLLIMLNGLGSLAYGELAGERMKLGLLLQDPEEEHDCFSDNTHNSHFYDILGMINVYRGEYRGIDGGRVSGPGLSALIAAIDPALDAEMLAKLEATRTAATRMKQRAETLESYDQMIGPGNPEGNTVVQAVIDRLTDQTRTTQRLVAALGLDRVEFTSSDSLGNPEAVFQ